MIAFINDPVFARRPKVRPVPIRPALDYKSLYSYSLLIPGLGQFMRGQVGPGFFYLLAALAAWGMIMAQIFICKYDLSIVDLWPIGLVHLFAAMNAVLPDRGTSVRPR